MLKKEKNLIILVVVLAFVFSLAGNIQAVEDIDVDFNQPFLLTSAGQSPDVQMARSLSMRAELDFQFEQVADGTYLEEVESVVFVVGGSSKGLGSAGLDEDEEKERIENLFAEIKERDIPVVGMQLGGAARRGHLSDEFIDLVFPRVDYFIVMEDANEDGKFTEIAEENDIPHMFIEKITDAQEPLAELFE